jgi:hypothetical protein
VSGLSAAHTVYLNGGNVLVLDKQSKLCHMRPTLPQTDDGHPTLTA